MKDNFYGVIDRTVNDSEIFRKKEELTRKGFTLLDSQLNELELEIIDQKLSKSKDSYISKHRLDNLKSIDEENTIRAPFLLDPVFLDICFNQNLREFIELIMGENYILNQQNVIINPSKGKSNQQFWHRDLPYQHFTSSKPLALNALFCLDDFSLDNGCTKVVPSSHLFESFPSQEYLCSEELHIEARRGSFIILDSMIFHSGSENLSGLDRVGINNVFSIPLIKRQLEVRKKDFNYEIPDKYESHLGRIIDFSVPQSVSEYLTSRKK